MDLAIFLLACYCILAGTGLGTLTGLVPGVHVNTMALLMLLSLPTLETLLVPVVQGLGADPDLVPLLLSCVIVAAAVTHSFLDFIPSVFVGVPDEDNCLSVLPGHRLLLAGKGYQAVRLAAEGSLGGAMLALLLSIPLLLFFKSDADPLDKVEAFIPGLVLLALVLMVMAQRKGRGLHTSFTVSSFRQGRGLCIVPARPVPGASSMLHGKVRRRLLRYEIETGQGTFPLRSPVRLPPGPLRLEGHWRLTRRRWAPTVWATGSVLLAGSLGVAVLWGRPPLTDIWPGLDGNMMFPLLTGLFGVPALLGSQAQRPIPAQDMGSETTLEAKPTIGGTLAGLFAGLVPGITSTSATVAGTLLFPSADEDGEAGAQRFIMMTAAVGTAAMVFGVLALVATGQGGTGALIVVARFLGDGTVGRMASPKSSHLALLLLSVLLSSLLAYALTIKVGRFFARHASSSSTGRLSRLVLVLILALCMALCGPAGLVILGVATLVGMIPPALGVSRVCLTGSLLVPLLLFYAGWEPALIAALGG